MVRVHAAEDGAEEIPGAWGEEEEAGLDGGSEVKTRVEHVTDGREEAELIPVQSRGAQALYLR